MFFYEAQACLLRHSRERERKNLPVKGAEMATTTKIVALPVKSPCMKQVQGQADCGCRGISNRRLSECAPMKTSCGKVNWKVFISLVHVTLFCSRLRGSYWLIRPCYILARYANGGTRPLARTARAASPKTPRWPYGYSILLHALKKQTAT